MRYRKKIVANSPNLYSVARKSKNLIAIGHFNLFYWMTECDIFGDKQLSTFMEFQIDYYVELARIRIHFRLYVCMDFHFNQSCTLMNQRLADINNFFCCACCSLPTEYYAYIV